MHNVHYAGFIKSLGLSLHPQQAARRMQKHPQHFKAVNNELWITAEYADFITHCANNIRLAQQLKGGANAK